jgi:FtsH-binding integral membrane protein
MEIYNDQQAVRAERRPIVNSASGVYKVFLWFALGLALTGGMAIGYPYLVAGIWGTGDAGTNVYSISLIVFFLAYLPLGIIVNISSLSLHSAWIKTFYILYSIAMGGLFSCFTLVIDMKMMFYAFLVTAGSFVLMGLLGIWTNGRIGKPLLFLIAAVFGLSVIAIFNLVFFRGSQYYSLYWIISVLSLVIFLLIAAVDINRVMKNAEAKMFDSNDTYMVYSAYCLYSDFIIIFYYVLRLMILIGASSKR